MNPSRLLRLAAFRSACVSAGALLLGGCETTDTSAALDPAPSTPVPGWTKTGEVFQGKMSWYSVKTNGGTRTASGEKLRDDGDTAAHRTLPFGTLIEVTNLANGRSVVLRVTDRGPFRHGRVIDVCLGAARKLGFEKNGVANCRVEVLRERGGAGPTESEATRDSRLESEAKPESESKSEGGE